MTIVCGYHACGQTWIGADTNVNGGDYIYPEKFSKIVRLGPWALGIAGSAATPSLIRRKGGPIVQMKDPQDIADFLQSLYREAGYKQIDSSGPPRYDQEVVLASRAGVWSISDGGIVGEPKWGFVAAGSGAWPAFGAAFVAVRLGRGGKEVVERAIGAACALDQKCGGKPEIFLVE